MIFFLTTVPILINAFLLILIPFNKTDPLPMKVSEPILQFPLIITPVEICE